MAATLINSVNPTIRSDANQDIVEFTHDVLGDVKGNPDSMYRRHLRLTKILLTNFKHVEALEQSKSLDKVTLALLYLVDTIGSTFPNKTIRKLSVTQQEIADSLAQHVCFVY